MADLSFTQGADPVAVVNDQTGNQLAINSDGGINANVAKIAGSNPSATNPLPVQQSDGSVFIDPRKISDGTTPTQFAKVDSSGRLWTYSAPSFTALPVQLIFDGTNTAVNANEWQDIIAYTVPSNYDLSISQFLLLSAQVADDARAVARVSLATYVSNTSTFTDGSSYTAPSFASQMFLLVTTLVGNVANDVVTITYTNQDGTTGRTATVTVLKNAPVGTRMAITLQGSDYGVRDITNITHTQPTQAGAWTIEGTIALAVVSAGTANVAAIQVFGLNAVSVPAGTTIITQYESSVNTAKSRRISLTGSLIPRS